MTTIIRPPDAATLLPTCRGPSDSPAAGTHGFSSRAEDRSSHQPNYHPARSPGYHPILSSDHPTRPSPTIHPSIHSERPPTCRGPLGSPAAGRARPPPATRRWYTAGSTTWPAVGWISWVGTPCRLGRVGIGWVGTPCRGAMRSTRQGGGCRGWQGAWGWRGCQGRRGQGQCGWKGVGEGPRGAPWSGGWRRPRPAAPAVRSSMRARGPRPASGSASAATRRCRRSGRRPAGGTAARGSRPPTTPTRPRPPGIGRASMNYSLQSFIEHGRVREKNTNWMDELRAVPGRPRRRQSPSSTCTRAATSVRSIFMKTRQEQHRGVMHLRCSPARTIHVYAYTSFSLCRA
jgi:hypothetical protein